MSSTIYPFLIPVVQVKAILNISCIWQGHGVLKKKKVSGYDFLEKFRFTETWNRDSTENSRIIHPYPQFPLLLTSGDSVVRLLELKYWY